MFSFSRSYALLTVLLVASTAGASSLFAQEVVTPVGGTASVTEMAAAARVVPLARGAPALPGSVRVASSPFVKLAPITPFVVVPFQDRVRVGSNIAMMGLGGAAFVVGIMMGGNDGRVIATTGGVIGLVGLFRYLR